MTFSLIGGPGWDGDFKPGVAAVGSLQDDRRIDRDAGGCIVSKSEGIAAPFGPHGPTCGRGHGSSAQSKTIHLLGRLELHLTLSAIWFRDG
jgi:hypothetical protein